jgi:2-hydroxy-3-keto-5-methylthiopentenyl-1-phosphate phosphatase
LIDQYKIFVDFDGTITSNDVGYEMFKKFTHAATEPLVQSYRRGEINSLDCLSRECDVWNTASPDIKEVYSYLDNQVLRDGFSRFLEMLGSWQIQPVILSEGFDFYINRILGAHGLLNLVRITNIARFDNGQLVPEFPYNQLGCRECSNCKGYHIRHLRPTHSCAIYIGDGHSDLHASRVADIVFARSHLMELLEETRREFIPYGSFENIIDEITHLLQRGLFTHSNRINYYRLSERYHESFQALWESGEVMRFVGYPNGLGLSQARYDAIWPGLQNDKEAIRLALEDKTGRFLGEAMLIAPDKDGFCQPDLKLLPEFWGRGLGFEAWQTIIDRSRARWPDSDIMVTPNIENDRAIKLYLKLGFEFDGGELRWNPPDDNNRAVPVRYRRMIEKNIARAKVL